MSLVVIHNDNIKNNSWIMDFLESQLKKNVDSWTKNRIYKHENQLFQFENDVFVRERKKGGKAFEMESTIHLGKGCHGSVNMVYCTFHRDPQEKSGIKVSEVFKRVVKDQSPKDSANEYPIALITPHIHPKKPTLSGRLVLRHLGDTTLHHFLAENQKTISRVEKLALSKELLKAYKAQIYDIKVGHYDLHKKNILIKIHPDKDLSARYEINIIDYGKAEKLAKQTAPDFNESVVPIIQSLWDKGTPEPLKRIFKHEYASLDNYINCFNRLILSPSLETQEPIDNLLYFLISLAKINHNLAVDLKKIIADAAQESSLNDMAPLKNAVEKCRAILKDRNISEPSFPAVAFDNDVKRQALFNQIERYYLQLEFKGKSLVDTEANEEGQKLCAAVKALREKTLDAIYNPKGMRVSQLQECQSFCRSQLKDNKQALEVHRNLNYLLAEIAVVFASLIILYPLVLGIHYYLTEKIGFFSETKSAVGAQKLDENFAELQTLIPNRAL
ncbi:MAG: hypothetical protein H0U73_09885 [Tatlockia sp.]|nr:hypothetical protein [Tatlockia sp.]